MHVKLKILRGSSAGKVVTVRGPRFHIGRSEECNLRVNSDAISRRHCEITVNDTHVHIRDLGSRNGTYVNGERIEGEQETADGGSAAQSVRWNSSSPSSSRPRQKRRKKPRRRPSLAAFPRTTRWPTWSATGSRKQIWQPRETVVRPGDPRIPIVRR